MLEFPHTRETRSQQTWSCPSFVLLCVDVRVRSGRTVVQQGTVEVGEERAAGRCARPVPGCPWMPRDDSSVLGNLDTRARARVTGARQRGASIGEADGQ